MKLKLLFFLAAAIAPVAPAIAQSDEIVGRAIGVPSVLTPVQAAAYRQVFAAIRMQDWQTASSVLDGMGDGPLHAVARAELYLAKGSPKVELDPLLALLARAPDLPEAAQLARLAEKRGATSLPNLPQAQRLIWVDGQPRRARAKSTSGDAAAAELDTLVQPLIRDNQPTAAEALLNDRQSVLTPEALAEYRQRVGWSYYIIGDDTSARRLADLSRAGVGEWTLQGEWLAGLSSWRMHDCNAASASFSNVAARATDPELAAAGHYWAARADMMCGHPERVQVHLRTASRVSETFYGMLAQSALGIAAQPKNATHDYHDDEWRRIANRPNVIAATGLVEIGEWQLADALIRQQCRISPADHQALIHLASDLNLPATQIWLAHNVPQGTRVDMAARYPLPNWRPTRGWRVDPPLVYAHTLQESGFQRTAVSKAGAVGLMQVRPGTAGDIARARSESFDAAQLIDPTANIEYGQSYLESLRDDPSTGGLLPKVIAAFNAGPVPVAQWNAREFDGGDPLLYIESIPYWETRGYVPIIFRNYWIYEQEAGRAASPSRKALVEGMWPKFPGMKGAPAVRITSRSLVSASNGTN